MLYTIDISCSVSHRPVVALIRFLDPMTRAPRRNLPILLEGRTWRINGYDLRGDEIVEVVSGDSAGYDFEVRVRKCGWAYRWLRIAAQSLLPAGPPSNPLSCPLPLQAAQMPAPADGPLASVVVPTRDRLDMLQAAIETAFLGADYPRKELIIVDNGSRDVATLSYLSKVQRTPNVTVVRNDEVFNFSRLINLGARASSGDVLVLLNNDVEAISSDWLTRLVRLAQDDRVGPVGAKLLYPSGRIQHAGIVLGIGGLVGHAGRGRAGGDPGPRNMFRTERQVSAVTAACMAVRRDVFFALGGFDERLSVEFNDVDFCLRASDRGWRTIWTPDVILLHKEGATRGIGKSPSPDVMEDQTVFVRRWGVRLECDVHYDAQWSRQTERVAVSKQGKR